MKKINYQCCFCGEKIESSNSDIVSIVAVINWDKEISKQQEQQFFCHTICFKQRLHETVPFYLPDLIE